MNPDQPERAAEQVAALAASAGVTLAPWQQRFLVALLAIRNRVM